MNGKGGRAKVFRSVVGMAVPAMVFLSGCPDQCAPAGQAEPAATEAAVAAAAAAAAPAAAVPSPEPAPPAVPAPTTAPPAARPPTTARAGGGTPTTASATPTAPTNPPITAAAGSDLFAEDFANPDAFRQRFDYKFDGDPDSGKAWAGNINEWPGDHDGSCGNPNTTSRTVRVTPGNTEQAFYTCLPADDPAKGHLMTSVNNEGYVIAWFSPKQTFTNVRRVCWDQNIQELGGGKWTQVLFLTEAEVGRVKGELGFTSPEFSDPGGTGTASGKASHGVKLEKGNMTSWSQVGTWNLYDTGTVQRPFSGDVGTTTDKAPRYQQCVTDNENGTLTAVRSGPNGTVTSSVQGEIPNEPIRVVFEDDNYNPDKHNDADGVARNAGEGYTWHWDNVQISG